MEVVWKGEILSSEKLIADDTREQYFVLCSHRGQDEGWVDVTKSSSLGNSLGQYFNGSFNCRLAHAIATPQITSRERVAALRSHVPGLRLSVDASRVGCRWFNYNGTSTSAELCVCKQALESVSRRTISDKPDGAVFGDELNNLMGIWVLVVGYEHLMEFKMGSRA